MSAEIFEKVNQFKQDLKKFVIISDFDFTITFRFDTLNNNQRLQSSFGVIEHSSQFSQKFIDDSKSLYEKYSCKEYDLSLSVEERRNFMNEWTSKELDLIIENQI